jgi:hypothetical protein
MEDMIVTVVRREMRRPKWPAAVERDYGRFGDPQVKSQLEKEQRNMREEIATLIYQVLIHLNSAPGTVEMVPSSPDISLLSHLADRHRIVSDYVSQLDCLPSPPLFPSAQCEAIPPQEAPSDLPEEGQPGGASIQEKARSLLSQKMQIDTVLGWIQKVQATRPGPAGKTTDGNKGESFLGLTHRLYSVAIPILIELTKAHRLIYETAENLFKEISPEEWCRPDGIQNALGLIGPLDELASSIRIDRDFRSEHVTSHVSSQAERVSRLLKTTVKEAHWHSNPLTVKIVQDLQREATVLFEYAEVVTPKNPMEAVAQLRGQIEALNPAQSN